ncbi:MAG TPA: hypothetical protein VF420_12985 [Casimicrobiaceae bacterium]
MIGIRKLFCLLVGVALAAFALPSVAATAPDKLFTINNPSPPAGVPVTLPPSPAVIHAGTTVPVTIKVTNESPKSGNSVINYVTVTLLNASADSATLSNASATSGSAVVCSGGTAVCVTSPGIKPSGTISITVNVTVDAQATCKATQWYAQAWTGSGGQPFTASPAGSDSAPAYIGCDGTLASCGGTGGTIDPTNPTGDDLVASGETGILRGQDTNGACSDAIGYSLGLNANTLTYTATKGAQQPSVEYIVIWNPVGADANGWAGQRPWVTWTGGTGTPAAPYWAPALPCMIDDVNGAPSAVMPTFPDQDPYNKDAYIGTPYYKGSTAKMCVVQHGFTANNSTDPSTVIYWDVIIDQIDSSTKYP